jgi:hypothetical protein
LLIEELINHLLSRENSLQLYPNPATDEVNILYNIAGDVTNIIIEISNLAGRSIGKYTVLNNDNLVKINTQSIKKGNYYVMLIIDGKKCNISKWFIQ